jgi:hypothetical protein
MPKYRALIVYLSMFSKSHSSQWPDAGKLHMEYYGLASIFILILIENSAILPA